MLAPALVASTGAVLVVILTIAGLAWHECLLLAGGAVATVRLFLIYMDSAAPWDGWRAALSCISAGALIAVSGLGLGFWASGVWIGWWCRGVGATDTSLALLAFAALLCCSLRRDGRWLEVGFWLPMLAMAAVATFAASHGALAAPCVLALIAAAALMRSGWHLASHTSSDLLRADAFR